MNRFFDTPYILSRELMPWESRRRGLPDTTGQFELQQSLFFRSDIAGGILCLEVGMISNLASIPDMSAAFLGINTDDQRIAGGAWVHDDGYQREGHMLVWNDSLSESKLVILSRKQMDQILCWEAMPDLGANKAQRMAAYQTLRWFGKQWKRDNFWERFT